jgi:uncharacterized protein YkwD
LRKLGAVILALPVLAAFYAASVVQRGMALRIAAGVAAAAVVALVVFVSQVPASSTAVPVSTPRPVSADLLEAVRTAHPLGQPFEISFDGSMDAPSVAGALRIAPEAAVRLTWDDAGRVLTVAPVGHWEPDTLYAVTVDRSARAVDGGALASPVHSVFLTAPAGTARLATDGGASKASRLDAQVVVTLDRPVARSVVEAALRTEPVVAGDLAQGDTATEFVFTPRTPLAPDTSYRVWLSGLVDRDGVPFADSPAIELQTVAAPSVVRFRPFDGTRKVQRSATLSVRFTDRMDRTTTAAAFHVTADGKAVKGSVAWAEHSEVLVFQPSAPLPYDARIRMSVDVTATSRSGVPIADAANGTFTVSQKPKPAPKPASTSIRRPGGGGGGGAVSGSWHSVEVYYLKLMNCTRTGGWVTSTGKCSSPGGRNVAALKLDSGISSHVSRPYAKLLATHNLCDHFVGGTPGDRLRKAGYTSYRWAENLGCRSGNPYSAVLGSHRYFQSEKSYSGGHYVNLMNAAYDRVGIGVWVSSGRVRLVVDFYHP